MINRQNMSSRCPGVVSYAELANSFTCRQEPWVSQSFCPLPAKSFKDVDPDVEVKQMRFAEASALLEKSRISLISIIWIKSRAADSGVGGKGIRCMRISKGQIGLEIAYATKEITVENGN